MLQSGLRPVNYFMREWWDLQFNVDLQTTDF